MICELAIRLQDRFLNDPAKDEKAGDVIVLRTEDQIKTKWSELHEKRMFKDPGVRIELKKYTDVMENDRIVKSVNDAALRWPWSIAERKMCCIIRMDLDPDNIIWLSSPYGFIDNEVFTQTKFRHKRISIAKIKEKFTVDEDKLKDGKIDYQPVILELIANDCIEDRK